MTRAELLDDDGGDGAVVSSLLSSVLGLLGNVLLDGNGDAVVRDGEDVGAGALAESAADAILVDRSLHVWILSLAWAPCPGSLFLYTFPPGSATEILI